MDKKTAPKKTNKKKGPIRTEALIPTVIIIILAWVYMHFFFDGHLRRGIEFGATYLHGAEVNVDDIDSSFWGGTFELSGLQVTDKDQPERNLVGIESIRMSFLWDALLRMKFVVPESGVTGIQLYSPRAKKGWVRPPRKAGDPPTAVEAIEENALKQAQEDNEGNPIGDAAKMLGGTDADEILKEIEGELKSEKRIKELQATLKQKEIEWKKRIEELKQSDDVKKLGKDLKKLDFNFKDPKQFKKDMKALKKILKEADSQYDTYRNASRDLKKDMKEQGNQIKQIDDWIEQDINDIEKRLKIPKLDGEAFAKALFMRMFSDKLGDIQKYWTVAEEYMPPPKTQAQKAERAKAKIVPRKRLEGQTYTFPVTKGYPLFWLQKAVISSEASDGGFSGNINGELTDLSSDPHIVAEPTYFRLTGEFPNQQVYGIKALLTLDHRTADYKDTLDAVVGSYPPPPMELAKGAVDIQLDKAQGTSQLYAKQEKGQVYVNLKNEFTKPEFTIRADSSSAQEAFTSIFTSISMVNVNAEAKGTWGDLDIDIDSNLGKALSKGLSQYVKKKVDALRAKVRNKVNKQTKGEREKLQAQYNKVKGQIDGKLRKKDKEVQASQKQLKKSSSSKSSAPKKKVKDDIKEKGKELLKKLKF